MEWKISNQLVDYNKAVDFMENRVDQILQNNAAELVWLLEHNHLYSAGISAKDEELLLKSNVPVYKTGRGGRYTYHGPGQRVIYLMIDLRKRKFDIKKYIYDLEEWIILSLQDLNINTKRKKERVGLWIDEKNKEKKIAAIGVRVRKWISYHGIALNVYPNLKFYDNIVACGIKEHGVTSIKELGLEIKMDKIDQILKQNFKKIF